MMRRRRSRKMIALRHRIFVQPGVGVLVNSQEHMAKNQAAIMRSATTAGAQSRRSVMLAPEEEYRRRRSLGVIAF